MLVSILKGLRVHVSFLVCVLKLSICAKGAQDLSRLGLIQYFMFSYLRVMFTNTFTPYGTIACRQKPVKSYKLGSSLGTEISPKILS